MVPQPFCLAFLITKFVGVGLTIFLSTASLAKTILTREAQVNTQKNNTVLTCSLEATSTSNGEIALSFVLKNPNDQLVSVHYFRPFTNFTLTVYADNEQVEVIQPAYDSGVQRTPLTIAAGETARIATPIRLRFDPDVEPSGGSVPTTWTLRRSPEPVLLRATVQLSNAAVAPCEVRFAPGKL